MSWEVINTEDAIVHELVVDQFVLRLLELKELEPDGTAWLAHSPFFDYKWSNEKGIGFDNAKEAKSALAMFFADKLEKIAETVKSEHVKS